MKSYDIDQSELINTPTDLPNSLHNRETHDSTLNQESRRFSNISSTIDTKKQYRNNLKMYTD